MRDILFICLLTAALWGLNAVWLARDTRPPVWDMALHQTYALNYAVDVAPARFSPPYWTWSGNYPPFVHLVIAFLFCVFQPSSDIAAFANLPATLLLLGSVYMLGRDLGRTREAGRWACMLTLLIPYLVWMSRETILDYWLSAWVAASLVLLRRTRGFQVRSASLLLGGAMALGLLTKWLFAGFLFLPLVYCCLSERIWRSSDRLINFFDSVILASVIAGVWYVPNLPQLVRYFGENAGIGAQEGEPPVLSFQSLIYYSRLLEGYQLFALLTLFFILALAAVWKRKLMDAPGFWCVALVGGWTAMTLLRTKDPRFTMPLLSLLAIPGGAALAAFKLPGRGRPLAILLKAAFVGLLCFQVYMTNFGVSRLPAEVILARGYQGSLRWDWNLYLQHYFYILGAPKEEDWQFDEILARMSQHGVETHIPLSLAFVPDLPRLNATSFTLYARLRKVQARVGHVRGADFHAFDGFNYVLMSEGEQGMPWTTGAAPRLNQIIVDDPQTFRLVELFPLPNGSSARLYHIRRDGKGIG
jgi:4-amino-4-deoxy-L-arabinose transferase-like glycosyltransferase